MTILMSFICTCAATCVSTGGEKISNLQQQYAYYLYTVCCDTDVCFCGQCMICVIIIICCLRLPASSEAWGPL